MKKLKILVTGNAGLLGSNFVNWLLANQNCEVIGIDDLSGGYKENLNPKCVNYCVNLTDLKIVKDIFSKEKPDIVYHLAAYAAEGLSPFIRKYNYENNLIASANLITCSIEYDVKRFVFASSMSVYGNVYNPPFTEKLTPVPIDSYAIAKYAVEQDLQVAYDQHGLDFTIIRPHNFYGINQNIWDKYRNVLGIWMYQIMNGNQPTIFGDGLQTRAFSCVSDAMKPMWVSATSVECIGESINLGGIKEYSINDACETLISVVGDKNIKPLYLEPRHETKYAFCTWDKSVKMLGFEHTINLEEGLSEMWSWAKSQPKRKRFFWHEYELTKGIYDYWKREVDPREEKVANDD